MVNMRMDAGRGEHVPPLEVSGEMYVYEAISLPITIDVFGRIVERRSPWLRVHTRTNGRKSFLGFVPIRGGGLMGEVNDLNEIGVRYYSTEGTELGTINVSLSESAKITRMATEYGEARAGVEPA